MIRRAEKSFGAIIGDADAGGSGFGVENGERRLGDEDSVVNRGAGGEQQQARECGQENGAEGNRVIHVQAKPGNGEP